MLVFLECEGGTQKKNCSKQVPLHFEGCCRGDAECVAENHVNHNHHYE